MNGYINLVKVTFPNSDYSFEYQFSLFVIIYVKVTLEAKKFGNKQYAQVASENCMVTTTFSNSQASSC